jgi:hypothetical protein
VPGVEVPEVEVPLEGGGSSGGPTPLAAYGVGLLVLWSETSGQKRDFHLRQGLGRGAVCICLQGMGWELACAHPSPGAGDGWDRAVRLRLLYH